MSTDDPGISDLMRKQLEDMDSSAEAFRMLQQQNVEHHNKIREHMYDKLTTKQTHQSPQHALLDKLLAENPLIVNNVLKYTQRLLAKISAVVNETLDEEQDNETSADSGGAAAGTAELNE